MAEEETQEDTLWKQNISLKRIDRDNCLCSEKNGCCFYCESHRMASLSCKLPHHSTGQACEDRGKEHSKRRSGTTSSTKAIPKHKILDRLTQIYGLFFTRPNENQSRTALDAHMA